MTTPINPRPSVLEQFRTTLRGLLSRREWALLAGTTILTILGYYLLARYQGPTLLVGLLVALFVGYFLPTCIALVRKVPNTDGVVIVNLLLGWTFLGWIVALVMACQQTRVVVVPQPQYRPGDVVNGWQLTQDGRWVLAPAG